MSTLGELSPDELQRRLRGPGLRLRTGPVVNCVRSSLDEVAEGLALHYAAHPLSAEDGFADFHVQVDRPLNWRRWMKPQAVFRFDGETPFAPLPGAQGFPMLEWGLNWCVSAHCHQYLIVHAAVLARGEHALVLPAPSGAGKSTLTAALALRDGWRLLSDELALFDPATGELVPLARPISLKNASIEVIARLAPEARMGRVVRETVKGRVTHVQPPPDAVRDMDRGARPRWVILPRYRAAAPARLQRIPRGQAFMRLVDNAFNYPVHGARGFEFLADVVQACDCHEFEYGDLGEALQCLAQLEASPDG